MTIQSWIYEPSILLNKEYIFELWPINSMCYEQKINAITRLIILLSILGYLLTNSKKIIVIGIITLIIIYILFSIRKEKLTKNNIEKFTINNDEGININNNENVVSLDAVLNNEFKEGTRKNPFSNVLLTEINDDPERKAAPPSFNPDVDQDITKNVKKAVQMLNPDIKNTNKQLFGDLYQQFELDNCLRVFNSTPNSKITNDQGAYSEYLYNNLKYSGKESTPEGAFARVQDNLRYINY
jgi:hypothetical protein